MALIFCVENGIFPAEEAEARYKQYLALKARGKAPAATATVPPPSGKKVKV
jgi:hypothetical protein